MEDQQGRRWSPVLVPLGVALVFGALGQPERAAVVAGLAVLAAVLIAAGVDVARGIERGAKHLGHALSTVAGTLVFLVVIGPAWTWGRITRRDPFARGASASGWRERIPAPPADESLGSPTPITVGRRGLAGRLAWSVGCVLLLLAANYGAGWVWDELNPTTNPDITAFRAMEGATQTPGPSTTVGSTMAPLPVSRTTYDPRADLPAMAAYPWRDRYFQDLQRPPSIYWPYTQYRPMPFSSPYINIDGWSRRTYRTPGSAEGRPVVWVLGGSTVWGEGQRDEYTIASWLVRLAEEAGIPVEVQNYGQRGWTHFQDMVLYDQLLALDGPPDAALFYDGINDVTTQKFVPEAVPSHYDVGRDAAAFDGKAFATRFGEEQPDAGSAIEDAWYVYSRHSLLHKVVRAVTSSSPAGAAPEPADPAPSAVDPAEDDPESAQDGIDAGNVYLRSQRLTRALSEQYDVPTLFYWQPFKWLGAAQQAATDLVEPPTIDISDLLLDHQDVFIDGAHTNEEGARIVAERLWKDLEPEVRSWYAEHP